jgi:hypothetical protein
MAFRLFDHMRLRQLKGFLISGKHQYGIKVMLRHRGTELRQDFRFSAFQSSRRINSPLKTIIALFLILRQHTLKSHFAAVLVRNDPRAGFNFDFES